MAETAPGPATEVDDLADVPRGVQPGRTRVPPAPDRPVPARVRCGTLAPNAVRKGTGRMAEDDGWDSRQRSLGEYLRVQRQLADLSLRQLAQLTHVSNAYLSQIERGLHQPSLRVLRSIADALDLSSDTLLTQAGLRNAAAHADRSAERTSTEEAILSDPDLSAEERETLVRVYRGLRGRKGA